MLRFDRKSHTIHAMNLGEAGRMAIRHLVSFTPPGEWVDVASWEERWTRGVRRRLTVQSWWSSVGGVIDGRRYAARIVFPASGDRPSRSLRVADLYVPLSPVTAPPPPAPAPSPRQPPAARG